jgi:hypothetical protein
VSPWSRGHCQVDRHAELAASVRSPIPPRMSRPAGSPTGNGYTPVRPSGL